MDDIPSLLSAEELTEDQIRKEELQDFLATVVEQWMDTYAPQIIKTEVKRYFLAEEKTSNVLRSLR